MKGIVTTRRGRLGFTLLEMMLSVAIFVLLITSAFALMGASTELITEVQEVQNQSSLRFRFVEACRAAFASNTSQSSLLFDYQDRGSGGYDTYLTFANTPGAFAFGAPLNGEISHIVLAAEARPDGAIRSGVYYLSALQWEEAKEENFQDISARYVELVPRMLQFSWRFFDSRSDQWQPNLDSAVATSLVEMTIQVDSGLPPIRSVFYLVPSAP